MNSSEWVIHRHSTVAGVLLIICMLRVRLCGIAVLQMSLGKGEYPVLSSPFLTFNGKYLGNLLGRLEQALHQTFRIFAC